MDSSDCQIQAQSRLELEEHTEMTHLSPSSVVLPSSTEEMIPDPLCVEDPLSVRPVLAEPDQPVLADPDQPVLADPDQPVLAEPDQPEHNNPPDDQFNLSMINKTTQNCQDDQGAEQAPIESCLNSEASALTHPEDLENGDVSLQTVATESILDPNGLSCFICKVQVSCQEALTTHVADEHSIVMSTEKSKQTHVEEVSKSDPKLNGMEEVRVHLFGTKCDSCDFKTTASYCLKLHIHQIHLKTGWYLLTIGTVMI